MVGFASPETHPLSPRVEATKNIRIQSFQLVGFSLFFGLFCFVLAALGFCCCARAFSSCEWELLLVVLCGLLIAVASLVAEHGL